MRAGGTIMKYTILAVLLILAATITVNAQTAPVAKTNEQIAAETNINVFFPDATIAARLTPEEQAALKLHLVNLMAASMKLGYQNGAKDSSDYLLKEFGKFAVEQQRLATQILQEFQQSKPSRLQRVAAALQGFGQGMQGFNQTMAAENARRINCVSHTIGMYTYTNCR